MHATVQLALDLPLDGASFFLFVPYPAARLRALALEHGRVSADWSDYSGHPARPPYVPAGTQPEALLRAQLLAYLRFFARWDYAKRHASLLLRPSVLASVVPALLRARR